MFRNSRQSLIMTLTLSALLFMGCHSKKPNNPKSSQPKIKLHELGIETDQTRLNTNQKQLLSRIENKKTVDQNLLFEIILEFHKQDFLKNQQKFPATIDKNPLMTYFNPLLGSMSPETDPHDFKMGYENLLALHNQQALKYNRDHTSVFSAIFANRMQCYSGTILFNIIYAKLKKSAYFDSNQVFIYEDGHVLPGYMTKIDNQWHLFGVETTLNGPAKKIYGPTSGLLGVRVVDAYVALGIEALKNQITNKAFVVKTALEKTAKLYDIPLDQTESSLSNVSIPIDSSSGSHTHHHANTDTYLNASLFQFGDSSHVPQGDLERETFDEFIAKPGGSGKSILTDPGNWKNTTTLSQNKPGGQIVPQIQGTLPNSQTKTHGNRPPGPHGTAPTPDTLQMTNGEEGLKVTINQDLVLNEKSTDGKSRSLAYYSNSKCVLANVTDVFFIESNSNTHSKKNLKTGEIFNVLGYDAKWVSPGFDFSKHDTEYRQLNLFMVSENSEFYLMIYCSGDDIANLWTYRDLEKLLDGVVSFEEKRNPVTKETLLFDNSEDYPPFLFHPSSTLSYPSSARTTAPPLLDIKKGLHQKKIQINENPPLVKHSLSESQPDRTVKNLYDYENENCLLVIEEKKSVEEDPDTNTYKEFYVSAVFLRKGKSFWSSASFGLKKPSDFFPYDNTLLVYATTVSPFSKNKNPDATLLSIKCTNRSWTLSTSHKDIETLLDGVVSFVDIEEGEMEFPL